jgi:hypothetical protein
MTECSAFLRWISFVGVLGLALPALAHPIPCPWDQGDMGCEELSTAHFRIHYAAVNETKAVSMARWIDRELVKRGEEMGALEAVTASPPITIRLAPDEKAFFAAQPRSSRIPEWAAGVAYGDRHLIVLSLATSHFFNLNEITRHEISHIAVRRAAGARIPRWLDEGLAILHAGEHVQSRILKSDGAALTGTLLPLEELTRGFPRSGPRAELAYAESYRFVHWLTNSRDLRARLPDLLSGIRSGRPFDEAFEKTMGLTLVEAESDWVTHLETSASWVAFLRDPEWLWGLAGLVFLIAYGVRQRALQRQIAAMPDGDEEVWPPHELPSLAPTAETVKPPDSGD